MGRLRLCRLRASSGTEAVRPASTGPITVACVAVGAPEPVLSPWDPGGTTARGVRSRGAGVGRGPPAWLALVVLHHCVRGCAHTRRHRHIRTAEGAAQFDWAAFLETMQAASGCGSCLRLSLRGKP